MAPEEADVTQQANLLFLSIALWVIESLGFENPPISHALTSYSTYHGQFKNKYSIDIPFLLHVFFCLGAYITHNAKKKFLKIILTNKTVSLLQYSAVDSNPLSVYVMHPFWNFVVKVRKNLVDRKCVSPSVCVCVYIINEVSKRLLR